ncbi:penicillin-insensitive murein endopeptidase [Succinimonas sp.]|uniref:penicillin-insensitive murein endopeptidase n=1 Tax=Succinimonas sp. TaxID=1936151 RepID=UPI00386D23F9
MLISSMLLAGAVSWGSFTTPLKADPNPIGSYSNGCIAGAVPLKLENPYYQVLRPQNNRYYGHPSLISFINDLAKKMNSGELAENRIILVGDMSMPRGGPFKGGHASHQIGLDVDIWFRMLKDGKRLTKEQLASPWALTVVADNLLTVNKHMDGYAYALLRNAASDDRVERIFVSPAIKKYACEQTHPDDDRSWLRKIRPWWGHTAHLHIRLACPPGTECEHQAPPPPGDGCKEADTWIEGFKHPKPAPKPAPKPKPKPKKILPETCQKMLNAS